MPELALIGLTGSRVWPDPRLLEDTLLDVWHDALQIGYDGIELIQGTAEGADTIGDQWARHNGIPVVPEPADWEGPCSPECKPGHRRTRGVGTYCPQAGHRRNQLIVDRRPLLLVAAAVRCTLPKCRTAKPHDSHGTADCMRRAAAAGIPIRRITA
ncbi:DUF2493 domain-containing protein [Streptomyces rectiviolaceus]|uniref:YspA cpYpsA-related SLOG domain-containing protein n=1 Tax=Streptomyces rectiviolaceus TaxID=332591 RepID=A0ABP6NNR2_9ACTN